MGKKLDVALAVLNGTVGDYLARTRNGLATEMQCVHQGSPIQIDRESLARAHPDASPTIALLVHGIMCTENSWKMRDGMDYGSLLARDLRFSPLYVRYNSGLAIPDNGAALDSLLDSVARAWPVSLKEILPIGFSMGGLVMRSACHAASRESHGWLKLVRRAIYLGTPHLGAPYERAGRVLTRVLHLVPDPVTRLVGDLGDLRSDGIKDLGDADLRHEDRARRRVSFALRDPRHPVPLLPGIQHFLIAGALLDDPWVGSIVGDSIVPLSSATNGGCTNAQSAALPPSHVKVLRGRAHMKLAQDPDAYAQIRAWCEEST